MEQMLLTKEQILDLLGVSREFQKSHPPETWDLREKLGIAKAQLKNVAERLPIKITTIGEERSVPNGTQIRFIFEDEWQAFLQEAGVKPNEASSP